jgi:hypothetical protein
VIRTLVRPARLLVLPTIALVAVVTLFPGRAELATRIYALLFSGLVLVFALAALRRRYPPATPLRPRRPRVGDELVRPPTLVQIEQETALAACGPLELHLRLRPRLRALAAALLAAKRGVSLDRDADSAREILGDDTWELVREDRPPPPERTRGRVSSATLERFVDSLERV